MLPAAISSSGQDRLGNNKHYYFEKTRQHRFTVTETIRSKEYQELGSMAQVGSYPPCPFSRINEHMRQYHCPRRPVQETINVMASEF